MIDEKMISSMAKDTGFVKAITESMINDLAKYFKNRHLDKKLKDANYLSGLFRPYLDSLAHQVSEITSIALSRKKLKIQDVYEPMFLVDYDKSNKHQDNDITIDYLFSSLECKNFIIIDNAGMGKSTFSKFLITKLLGKSIYMPVLFELRKINKDIDLVGNLAKQFDWYGNEFNRDLFYKLLEIGKFFIILDGFDEVELDFQSKLTDEIKNFSFKYNKNRLIITSRFQGLIPQLTSSRVLKFEHFNIDQATSLIKRYDLISNSDIGERLLKEIDKVPERLIETPLLVSLLYNTFGFNNSIADRVSTFYDEIYQSLYKGHDLINKDGYIRKKKSELDYEDFRKLLRALCFLMILKNKISCHNKSDIIALIKNAMAISSVDLKDSVDFLDDLLESVPLMQVDGNEYKFLHKTIIEYFAADYIVHHKSSGNLIESIVKSDNVKNFSKVFEFLADIDITLFENSITYPLAKEILDFLHESNEDYDVIELEIKIIILFLKKVRIGLWTLNDHSKTIKEESESIVIPRGIDIIGNMMIWLFGNIDNVEYIITMGYIDKKYVHNISIKSLSEENINMRDGLLNHKDSHDLTDIASFFPINQWIDVDFEKMNVLSFRRHPVISSLIFNLLSHILLIDGNRRLFSLEKIKKFIDQVEYKKKMEFDIINILNC